MEATRRVLLDHEDERVRFRRCDLQPAPLYG